MQETVLPLSDHLKRSMTLHEQYKAFIKKYEYYEPFHWLIKESFLDSIDCMLAMIIGATSEEGHYLGKHLKEQRELITNEN